MSIIKVHVHQEGRFLKAIGSDGLDYSNQVERPLRKQAAAQGLVLLFNKTAGTWGIEGQVDPSTEPNAQAHGIEETQTTVDLILPDADHHAVKNFIHTSVSLRPSDLIMSDVKWKYMVRSAIRGKNICLLGDSGGGKTKACKALVDALQRPNFMFNMGSTQDPRATLIGNTQFNPEEGTFLSESQFVKAIQIENAVIALDELSRAHPEAWNILIPVLDPLQRCLRLDEAPGSPVIKVAPGVSFLATANIGTNYTATRVMDRALTDRFIFIEIDELNMDQEFSLLKMYYPKANPSALRAIAEIASMTRSEFKTENSKISTKISTRVSLECAGLSFDGFTIAEIADVAIYPYFSEEGRVDSERTYIKQVVQKFVSADENKHQKDDLFDDQDIAKEDLPF
mgnify:CR=1 FL=1